MARKIKIDNAILKRRQYKRGKKQVGKRQLRKYILIVCEGAKTEPNYFESIRKSFPKPILETYSIEIKGTGTSTLKIIEIAIELRKKARDFQNRHYDYVWAVFDKDSFPNSDFDNAIFKGQSAKIDCAWSNEAFELWYILHFQYRNTPMSREDYKKKIEQEVNAAMKKAGDKPTFKYQKNDRNMYEILQKYGNETQAILNAEKLKNQFVDRTDFHAHNPSTRVYELIELLNKIRDSI